MGVNVDHSWNHEFVPSIEDAFMAHLLGGSFALCEDASYFAVFNGYRAIFDYPVGRNYRSVLNN
jgi:hypothetical protein